MKTQQRQITLKVMSALVMTSCAAVVFACFVVSQNISKVMQSWGQDIQMAVYLSEGISSDQQASIESYLKSKKQIARFSLVTQQQALDDFRLQLAAYAPDLAKDDELLQLIPASYAVQIDPSIESSNKVAVMKDLAEQLKQQAGVEEVSYGQDWLQKYSAILAAFEKGSWIIGLIVGLATILVMSNSIRAVVINKRDEIEILEMIGATKAMIRRPFLIEGVVTGIGSAALAVLLIAIVFKGLISFMGRDDILSQLTSVFGFPNLLFVITFIGIFGLIGGVGSYLSVAQINTGWAASKK